MMWVMILLLQYRTHVHLFSMDWILVNVGVAMARNPTKPRKNFRRGSGSREKGSRIDFLKQVLTFFNGFFLVCIEIVSFSEQWLPKGELITFIQLAGLGVLAVGIWTIVHKHHYASIFLSTTYAFAAYLLIAAGCVVVIAWVVGCMGIYKLRKSWMVTVSTKLLATCGGDQFSKIFNRSFNQPTSNVCS